MVASRNRCSCVSRQSGSLGATRANAIGRKKQASSAKLMFHKTSLTWNSANMGCPERTRQLRLRTGVRAEKFFLSTLYTRKRVKIGSR